MRDEDKQLDEWLAAARWPATDAKAEARLAGVWHDARRTGWTIELWRAVARPMRVAAAIAIVATAGVSAWWAMHRPVAPRMTTSSESVQSVIVARPVEVPPAPPIEARAPTDLERAMLRAPRKSRPAPQTTVEMARTPMPVAPVARAKPSVESIARDLASAELDPERKTELMRSLLADGSRAAVQLYLQQVIDPTTRAAALDAIGAFGAMPVDALMRRLNDPLVDVRLAAARTLGRIDGPVLTARLAEMATRDQNRREALIALACSDGPAAKEFVRRAAEGGPLASAARSALSQCTLQ